jgi:hypothetical protein
VIRCFAVVGPGTAPTLTVVENPASGYCKEKDSNETQESATWSKQRQSHSRQNNSCHYGSEQPARTKASTHNCLL